MRKAVLLAAWGASTAQGRFGLIHFEDQCRARFAWPIRWAYTSQILRSRLTSQRQKSDSVYKALKRLHYEGYEAVAIQPLQTIAGREYEAVLLAAAQISAETGMACAVGDPLLASPAHVVASALVRSLPKERDPGENVIFMGHGGQHQAVEAYAGLARAMQKIEQGVFIGVMNGEQELAHILPQLDSHRVWLLPLLSSVGQHTLRDMAGANDSSWKSRLEKAGYRCQPVLAGMIEAPELASIWQDNLDAALAALPA